MSCLLPVTPGLQSCRRWHCRGTRNQAQDPSSPGLGIPSGLKDKNKGLKARVRRGAQARRKEVLCGHLSSVPAGTMGPRPLLPEGRGEVRSSAPAASAPPAPLNPEPTLGTHQTLHPNGPGVPICCEKVNLARPLIHSLTAAGLKPWEPVGVNYSY